MHLNVLENAFPIGECLGTVTFIVSPEDTDHLLNFYFKFVVLCQNICSNNFCCKALNGRTNFEVNLVFDSKCSVGSRVVFVNVLEMSLGAGHSQA